MSNCAFQHPVSDMSIEQIRAESNRNRIDKDMLGELNRCEREENVDRVVQQGYRMNREAVLNTLTSRIELKIEDAMSQGTFGINQKTIGVFECLAIGHHNGKRESTIWFEELAKSFEERGFEVEFLERGEIYIYWKHQRK